MLALLSAIFGFFAPFLPEVLKFFKGRQDNQHELAMMELRLKAGAQEHLWRMEEITTKADIAELTAIRAPQTSFGVQILDAARQSGLGFWAIVPAFYLFTLLDFLAGLVRPMITYAAFAAYLAYKWARLMLMQQVSDQSFAWYEGVVKLWQEQDWAVLTLVLSYWFGARMAKAAFGGNASHGGRGQ
jgi:hypothetical protein